MTIRQIPDVALGAFGPSVYKRVIQAMGLDLEYYNYKDCSSGIEAVASEKGRQPNTPTVHCTAGVFALLICRLPSPPACDNPPCRPA